MKHMGILVVLLFCFFQVQTSSAKTTKYAPNYVVPPKPRLTKYISPISKDTDFDGLSDSLENKIGTDTTEQDTDGDTLTDYEEYYKYKTDPLKKDSDNDGVPDNDWNERRQYTTTISADLEVAKPYDFADMNTLFQDMKPIEEKGNKLFCEIVLYPNAEYPLVPTLYPIPKEDYDPEVQKYLEPTRRVDPYPEMEEEVREIVKDCHTDVEVIQKLLSWFRSTKFQKRTRYGRASFRGDISWKGSVLYKKRVLETCATHAILFATLCRAVGIPVKIVASVPLLSGWTDAHQWNEVYINNHWVPVDANGGINFLTKAKDLNLFMKIIDFEGYSKVNLSYWVRVFSKKMEREKRNKLLYYVKNVTKYVPGKGYEKLGEIKITEHWNKKLKEQFNSWRNKVVVISRREPCLAFKKGLTVRIPGFSPHYIPERKKLVDSSHVVTLFSPDQMKIPEKYHYLIPFEQSELLRILGEGNIVIASKVEGGRYLILVAAPDRYSLFKAIARFKSLDSLPSTSIIFEPK